MYRTSAYHSQQQPRECNDRGKPQDESSDPQDDMRRRRSYRQMQVMDQIPSVRLSSGPIQRPNILTLSVAEARRIPQIDGLRAIAILMVFAAHAFAVPLFWMGVDLFFVLSGYLITGILLRLKQSRSSGGRYWSCLLLPPDSANSSSLYCISRGSKPFFPRALGPHLVLVRLFRSQYSACAR